MALKIELRRGKTKKLNFTVLDPGSNAANPPAVDLTGKTLKFTVKKVVTDSSPVFQKTIGAGITITDAAAGKGQVLISPSDTQSLTTDGLDWVWDLQMTWNAGAEEADLNGGAFLLLPDVG